MLCALAAGPSAGHLAQSSAAHGPQRRRQPESTIAGLPQAHPAAWACQSGGPLLRAAPRRFSPKLRASAAGDAPGNSEDTEADSSSTPASTGPVKKAEDEPSTLIASSSTSSSSSSAASAASSVSSSTKVIASSIPSSRRSSSSGSGSSSSSSSGGSQEVLDAFFLGRALAEVVLERVGSTVGELLSEVSRVQAEQQQQIRQFQEEVTERATEAQQRATKGGSTSKKK